MPKLKPTEFKAQSGEFRYELLLEDPEECSKIPDDIWHGLWVKIDEAYVLLQQFKSSAIEPALEAQAMLKEATIAAGKEYEEDHIIIKRLLGEIYYMMKDYDTAEPLLGEAGQRYGDSSINLKYAKCLGYLEEHEAALEYFDGEIEQSKEENNYSALSYELAEKARYLINQGKYDEALELVHEAIEADPTEFLAYTVLGRIYLKNTDLDLNEGLEILEAGASKCKDPYIIPSAKGELLAAMERYEEAIEFFKEAIKNENGREFFRPFDYARIGDALFKLGILNKDTDYNEAIRYLEMAQELMDREGYVLNEYMTSVMDTAFSLRADVMRILEEFDVESTDASSEDHEDSEEEEGSYEDERLKEEVEEAVASVKAEARTAVAEAKAALVCSETTPAELQSILSQLKNMRQELDTIKAEKTKLASDAESVRAYLVAKEAQKEYTNSMLEWIKADVSLKEYYSSFVSKLDELIVSAKAAKGGFVDESSGTGIIGGSALSNLPFAGSIIGFVNSAIKGVQSIRTSNDASRTLTFEGAETVTGFEKMLKKIAIEACKGKYTIIRTVTLDDEDGFSLLHKFSVLKAKFVEERSITPAQKLGIQDAMTVAIALKAGEFHGMTQEQVVNTSIAYVTNADTQRGFFEKLTQGFALTTSKPAHTVACDSDSSTDYSGGYDSPEVLPSGYGVYQGRPLDAMTAAGGGSSVKAKKGFFGKFFNADPEFMAICEAGDFENGFLGKFAFAGDHLDHFDS